MQSRTGRGEPMSAAERELRARVAEGRLRVLLQLSRPRSSSNAITRLAATGVDVPLRSYAMELPEDSEHLFDRILEEVHEHPASRAREEGPLLLYMKEHAASLGPGVLERLDALVSRYVLVIRDPLLTHASYLRLLALPHRTPEGERECSLVRALARKLLRPSGPALLERFRGPLREEEAELLGSAREDLDPRMLELSRELLESYAARAGAASWRELQAGMERREDFTPLDDLLPHLYPIEGGPEEPGASPPSPRRRLTHDPYGFLNGSWQTSKELLRRHPERCVIIDATALQARGPQDREIHRFAEALELRALRRSGWADARADRTLGLRSAAGAAWYQEALASSEFRLPTRPALPSSALPSLTRKAYLDDLADYVAFLSSPRFVGPRDPDEVEQMLSLPIGPSGGTIGEANPTTAYALLAAAGAEGGMRASLREGFPEHDPTFAAIDRSAAPRPRLP